MKADPIPICAEQSQRQRARKRTFAIMVKNLNDYKPFVKNAYKPALRIPTRGICAGGLSKFGLGFVMTSEVSSETIGHYLRIGFNML